MIAETRSYIFRWRSRCPRRGLCRLKLPHRIKWIASYTSKCRSPYFNDNSFLCSLELSQYLWNFLSMTLKMSSSNCPEFNDELSRRIIFASTPSLANWLRISWHRVFHWLGWPKPQFVSLTVTKKKKEKEKKKGNISVFPVSSLYSNWIENCRVTQIPACARPWFFSCMHDFMIVNNCCRFVP